VGSVRPKLVVLFLVGPVSEKVGGGTKKGREAACRTGQFPISFGGELFEFSQSEKKRKKKEGGREENEGPRGDHRVFAVFKKRHRVDFLRSIGPGGKEKRKKKKKGRRMGK